MRFLKKVSKQVLLLDKSGIIPPSILRLSQMGKNICYVDFSFRRYQIFSPKSFNIDVVREEIRGLTTNFFINI